MGVAAHLAAAEDTSLQGLRVLSLNCGGVRGKLERLVALLVETDPDVAFLQEAAGPSSGADLGVLGLQVFTGAERRCGGLAILIRRQLLPAGHRALVACPGHGLLLAVRVLLAPDQPIWLCCMHTPPGLAARDRAEARLDLNRTVDVARGGRGVLAGDFNAPLQRSWLADASVPAVAGHDGRAPIGATMPPT